MSKNLNAVRQPKFWECERDHPHVTGASVTPEGLNDVRLGMNRIRLLENFRFDQRDEKGRRVRPVAPLTNEQVADLEGYGFEFEPSQQWPGHWHPIKSFKIGQYYRQGY